MFASSSLRPARAFTVRLNAAMLAPCTSAASASAAPFSTLSPPTANPTRPSKSARTFQPIFPSPVQTALRCASSTSQATPAAPQQQQQQPSSSTQLTWNDFLALRRVRRRYNVVASGFTSFATLYGGLRVFIEQGYDASLSAMVGIDPLMVTGISSVAMLATGWLIGPVFGGALFNMRNSAIRGEIINKEREFFNRIKSHRVDPAASNMNNPVPDYYGEKIGSIADYRRWLKDQRAFKLKRGAYTPK